MKRKDTGIQLVDSADAAELWDLKIEPQYNDDGMIDSGVVIDHTLYQNQATLLAMYPGELKSEPTLGVGLKAELLNENLLEARHRVREVFTQDGLLIKRLELYDAENIDIVAEYES